MILQYFQSFYICITIIDKNNIILNKKKEDQHSMTAHKNYTYKYALLINCAIKTLL